jgi:hypothetical protein
MEPVAIWLWRRDVAVGIKLTIILQVLSEQDLGVAGER